MLRRRIPRCGGGREQDVMARIAHLGHLGRATPAVQSGQRSMPWLRYLVIPEVRQLILLDAPVVLGWAGFRDVAQRSAWARPNS